MKLSNVYDREFKDGEGLRDAALVLAGAAVAGGALYWALRRPGHRRDRAPGWPGEPPRWGFASKDGVGTAIAHPGSSNSRVWFTLRHGALTEIYYPHVDQPAVNALGLVVTGPGGFSSDEVRDAGHETRWLDGGI
ncbi:MAG: hypothetical protein LC745_04815, partial [Planctomycetia bacterium]|nr:hypothetical protein [Planctomycetia bacterium]